MKPGDLVYCIFFKQYALVIQKEFDPYCSIGPHLLFLLYSDGSIRKHGRMEEEYLELVKNEI